MLDSCLSLSNLTLLHRQGQFARDTDNIMRVTQLVCTYVCEAQRIVFCIAYYVIDVHVKDTCPYSTKCLLISTIYDL